MSFVLERKIPSRFIGLSKILQLINGEHRITYFEDRLKAQKAIFLYQIMAEVDLGYYFKLDDFGPYSEELADDYRDAFSIPDPELEGRVASYQIGSDRIAAIEKIKILMEPSDEFEHFSSEFMKEHGDQVDLQMSSTALWLELLTSYMAIYLELKERKFSSERLLDETDLRLKKYKPQLDRAIPLVRNRADEFRHAVNI
ncbi:hypothetical protein [Deinococcus yunweiensis]|uniref:hypothetical protein n=1 Tax=Deinococcus yunweiensis TaxID=367282 RepID=UPI00398E698E